MISMTYDEQNQTLANDILYRNYYSVFGDKDISSTRSLSFIIDNQVTKNNFCFNNFDSLKLSSWEERFNNLNAFIDWYITNDFQSSIELFGENWQIDLNQTHAILGMLLNKLGRARYKPKKIVIHGNCQFITNTALKELWEEYIKAFAKMHIIIFFETYVNGEGLDEDDLSSNYYQQYFNWRETHFTHNTLTLTGIYSYRYLTNLDWWLQHISFSQYISMSITEDKQHLYSDEELNMLSDYYTYLFQLCIDWKPLPQFAEWLINSSSILQLNPAICSSHDSFDCHCYNSLTIDLSSLAVGLCPNLSNSLFIIGHYKIEEDKIIDFAANNVDLLIIKDHLKRSELPKCIDCLYAGICNGICLSCNYNISYNPLIPVYEVCMLSRAKYSLLFYLVKEKRVLEEWEKMNTPKSKYLIAICQEVNKNV